MSTRKFSEFPEISPDTLAVLTSLGFSQSTPVQEATIPLFCGNKDVAVDACTGSGKTLAFLVPVVEKLRRLEEKLKLHQVGAIVVSPTRELARQIFSVAGPLMASVPWLRMQLLVGGTDTSADVASFKENGGHVLVGTPGRIDDVMKRCALMDMKRLEILVLDEADGLLDMGFKIQLDSIIAAYTTLKLSPPHPHSLNPNPHPILFPQILILVLDEADRLLGMGFKTQLNIIIILVLDEADRLLDMGFKTQLNSIMGRLPRQRRTGLFSATQTEAVQALSRAGLRNPIRINVAVNVEDRKLSGSKASASGEADKVVAPISSQVTPTGLSIEYITCETNEKIAHLIHFLQHHKEEKIIVYFLTCSCVDFYQLALKKLKKTCLPDAQVFALHGRMKQSARESTLESYSKLPAGVLLCTDLASRGLDIPDVHWIVQLDPPQDPSAFVHRVGRTARMGRSGSAVVYLLPHETSYIDFLRLRKIPITEGSCPDDLPTGLPELLRKEAESDREASQRSFARRLKATERYKCLPEVFRKEAESNREVMEAGTKAFVSFVRGYKEHHCKFIFRLQDLSLGRLANSLAILRLPGMPEVKKALRGGRLDHFEQSKFKEKAREKQRQVTMKKKAAAAELEKAEGRAEAKRHVKKVVAAPKAGERLPAAKRRRLQEKDETEELGREYMLLKKLKRGKITQRQFDAATGLTDDDSDDDVPAPRKKATGKGKQDSSDDDSEEEKPKKRVVGNKAVAKLRSLLDSDLMTVHKAADLESNAQIFGGTALSGSNMQQALMMKHLRKKKRTQRADRKGQN
eukprot:gene18836-25384_t